MEINRENPDNYSTTSSSIEFINKRSSNYVVIQSQNEILLKKG